MPIPDRALELLPIHYECRSDRALSRLAGRTMHTNVIDQEALAPSPHGTLAEVGKELSSRPYVRRGVAARTERITVMLVDDHHLVRTGIKAILRSSTDITVVGEADGGRAAVAL